MEYTQEKIELINEAIASVKNNTGIASASSVKQQLLYDFQYGTGAAAKFLAENWKYVFSHGRFTEMQAEKYSRDYFRSGKTKIVSDIREINWSEVVYDGHDYCLLSDGTRVEVRK